jgi:transposase-like protein
MRCTAFQRGLLSPSPNVPPSPPRDWDAIARDYAAGDLTITEICTLHGISSSTLYSRANKSRWKKRKHDAAPKAAPNAAAPEKAAAKSPPRKRRAKQPPDLTQRLLTALDQKMTEFETRMAEGAPTNAADSERDARTLNTLVRLFDKLKSFGEKPGAAKKSASPATPDTSASAQPSASGTDAHDADRLRHAQRLARLGRELNSR